MNDKERLIFWINKYERAAKVFMVEILQNVLDSQSDPVQAITNELNKWLEVKKNTRIYGTRHAEAWCKSDELKFVLDNWGNECKICDKS